MHNKISLIGNVGNEPEVRSVGENKVVSISLGVTEKGYTTKDGKKVEGKTTWFRVSFWRGLAEVVEKYVFKGDKLFVEGKMTSRDYEVDGVKKTAWEVLASDVELLTPKKDGANKQANNAQKPKENYEQNNEELPF